MSLEKKLEGRIPEGQAMGIVCNVCGTVIIIGQDKHIRALDGTSVIRCKCGKEFELTVVHASCMRNGTNAKEST